MSRCYLKHAIRHTGGIANNSDDASPVRLRAFAQDDLMVLARNFLFGGRKVTVSVEGEDMFETRDSASRIAYRIVPGWSPSYARRRQKSIAVIRRQKPSKTRPNLTTKAYPSSCQESHV